MKQLQYIQMEAAGGIKQFFDMKAPD